MLAIYVLFWSFSVFLVLPFGVKTSAEAGAEHVPGTAGSHGQQPPTAQPRGYRASGERRRGQGDRAELRI